MTISPCRHDGADAGKLDQLFKDVLTAEWRLGKELFELVGAGARAACGTFGKLSLPRGDSCCDIPPACWMPKPLGEITCRLRPGETGQVKLLVTNNDFRGHDVIVRSAGHDAAMVSITPGTAALGAKERVHVAATFTAPRQPGTYEVVLWVSVCSDFYLRWTVEVGERGGACCYEVTVDDTPDYTVHWYDHFYCQKPCMGTHGRIGANG